MLCVTLNSTVLKVFILLTSVQWHSGIRVNGHKYTSSSSSSSCYNLVPDLTAPKTLFHFILFSVLVFHLLTHLLVSYSALSNHLKGGLPTFLVQYGFENVSFLQVQSSYFLHSCPPLNTCGFQLLNETQIYGEHNSEKWTSLHNTVTLQM